MYRYDCRLWNHGLQVNHSASSANARAYLVRDANGIRPLCVGSRPSATLEGATDYFMASESIALRQLGFSNIFDVKPGQAVFVQKGGQLQTRQIVERKSYTPDA